jgi:hypothetical protein
LFRESERWRDLLGGHRWPCEKIPRFAPMTG